MTKKEVSVEDKLRTLYALQLIDCKIDELRNVRGELPLEVEDLEDEAAGLESRAERLVNDIDKINVDISTKKNLIEESKGLIKKYAEQQKNVRNNREFNAISKEIEFQELEIQLAEKHLKEFKAEIEQKKLSIAKIKDQLEERKKHLQHKKEELSSILEETQKDEETLLKKSLEISSQIEPRLLSAYQRIRNSVVNRLAIVPVERGASGGSFFVIPPQVQVEISTRKKIITDEHSGRILIDPDLAREEKEKMEEFFQAM